MVTVEILTISRMPGMWIGVSTGSGQMRQQKTYSRWVSWTGEGSMLMLWRDRMRSFPQKKQGRGTSACCRTTSTSGTQRTRYLAEKLFPQWLRFASLFLCRVQDSRFTQNSCNNDGFFHLLLTESTATPRPIGLHRPSLVCWRSQTSSAHLPTHRAYVANLATTMDRILHKSKRLFANTRT